MGLNIVLEGEHGQKIDGVSDSHHLLLTLIKASNTEKTYCLRFIDPYGDTVFNYLQMEQFLGELANLHAFATNPEQRELLSNIEKLARRCKDGRHLYVKIYGD